MFLNLPGAKGTNRGIPRPAKSEEEHTLTLQNLARIEKEIERYSRNVHKLRGTNRVCKDEPKEVFQKFSGTESNKQSCSKLLWSKEEQGEVFPKFLKH